MHWFIFVSSIGPDKRIFEHKIVVNKVLNVFSSIILNMCFRCSKEPSHGDGSFEYPQHIFCLRYKNYFYNVILSEVLFQKWFIVTSYSLLTFDMLLPTVFLTLM